MSRDLLLARRLFEAVADPNADRQSAEEAGSELVEILGRINAGPGRGVPVTSFEDMRVGDLSPHAWLLLLESRPPGEPQIPSSVLDSLFLNHADPAIRFRLVSGALTQGLGGPAKSFEWLVREGAAPLPLSEFPPTWARDFLIGLPNRSAEDGTPAALLTEIGLYLLQDGSSHALALAAAAIAPGEDWRQPGRRALGTVIRSVDPNLVGPGRYFEHVGI